jgi:hypothetical protein
MEFQISQHAELQLQDRQIPRAFLEAVLESPQQIVNEGNDKQIYQSCIEFENGKVYLVRAIVGFSTAIPTVITVYRTTQIKRYWRETE